MNKKADFINGIVVICILIIVILLIILLSDSSLIFKNINEQGNYYCKIKYGESFSSKYDGNLRFYYCGSVTENGTLIKYYFNEEYKEYCKNKFWKLNDCPDL